MPTPAQIMEASASTYLNDSTRALYPDSVILPHFNQAMRDLQEEYELNDVPVTHETSAIINVPLGTAGTITRIAKTVTAVRYPSDLIEIKQLWQSPENQNIWTPITKKEFINPEWLIGETSYFYIWAWINDEIHLVTCVQDNDIKIDYIKKLFNTVLIGAINVDLGAKFDKCFSYLSARTASLAARYIGENPTRADELQLNADDAMENALGIATKGAQSIMTRRKPFRAAYKGRYVG